MCYNASVHVYVLALCLMTPFLAMLHFAAIFLETSGSPYSYILPQHSNLELHWLYQLILLDIFSHSDHINSITYI